jgi:hypothetical protein
LVRPVFVTAWVASIAVEDAWVSVRRPATAVTATASAAIPDDTAPCIATGDVTSRGWIAPMLSTVGSGVSAVRASPDRKAAVASAEDADSGAGRFGVGSVPAAVPPARDARVVQAASARTGAAAGTLLRPKL